jgi:hypothetical protein
MRQGWLGIVALLGSVAFGLPGHAQASSQAPPTETPQFHFLVIDDRFTPHVRVSWEGADGNPVVLEADRAYTAPGMRSELGHNLDCFVALGGTRLDKQAGHPDGAIVRVGLYKRDPARPLFEGLERDSVIEVRLTNIVFDKPAVATPESGVQHLKYSPDGLAECGLAGAAFELYNTVSETDNLKGSVTPTNGRLGVLASEGAEFAVTQEADGTFTLVAKVPYSLLRHVQDPWQLTKPGTFLEPLHFHLEFEAVPLLLVPDALRPGDPPPAPKPSNADVPGKSLQD